jgi:HPt (histidine-containing phosphotransfer) domain-containing protein
MTIEVLKIDEALERIGGDREFLFELLNEFVKQVDENLVLLDAAVKKADFDTVILIAHKLRGSAGNLSASKMYQALSDIESFAAEEKNDLMKQPLAVLLEQCLELKKLLKKW